MDMASIGAGLTSFKAVLDITNILKNSVTSLGDAEINLKFAELLMSLADLKTEIAETQYILVEKDKRIKDLETKLNIRDKMVFEDPVYWMYSDGKKDGPFCPQCYDSKEKVIRLQTYGDDNWKCETCGTSFFGKNFNPGVSIERC